MSDTLIAFFSVWLACGIAQAGFTYAFFQREYWMIADAHRGDDCMFAWVIAVSGPVGLAIAIADGGIGHGWIFPGVKS